LGADWSRRHEGDIKIPRLSHLGHGQQVRAGHAEQRRGKTRDDLAARKRVHRQQHFTQSRHNQRHCAVKFRPGAEPGA
jgi:hypothetical protein